MYLHPEPQTFGERLRLARLARGLTQQALADAIQVSKSEISRLERGETRDPGATRVKQLAEALGVSGDVLLGKRDTETAPETAW